MELYNVQHFNQQGVPLPSPPRSEDESSITESIESFPVTPPLTKEHTPRNFYHPAGMGYSSSDSLDQQPNRASVPKLSNINGTKTKTSSVDADQSARTSSSREADQSGENAMENEWIEQDEPGVYVTIRTLPGGARELRRVRFRLFREGEPL
ncbi:Brevis radix-like protein 4 [Tanacetum coccineum]